MFHSKYELNTGSQQRIENHQFSIDKCLNAFHVLINSQLLHYQSHEFHYSFLLLVGELVNSRQAIRMVAL
jgi:hypothetical protein